ncbi:MAG: asparagine synthase (glutamine-hydrolyzing) [Deltaproteobacteria bacterium]|nr:asparagine synthase (glutamine-hydrolyzing) [Deltaproteobacteria bacterium]
MCGICGFSGERDDRALSAMMARMSHRGPDGEGSLFDPLQGVSLGHRRLAVVDIEGGSQPMTTADGSLSVVFNGEIYNHAVLRKSLIDLGHRFITHHSDTEVLLHGYRQWGLRLPERLNGQWAFAILDRDNRRLFLSRDRFGEKPLFYHEAPGFFAFASELSALAAHPSVPSSLDRKSLVKYFAYGYIPAPRSLYEGVKKLPAGKSLVYDLDSGKTSLKTHFTFLIEPFEKIPKRPEDEWGEEIRRLLAESVRLRLIADVPVGVFLSGGIDSSAVAAFASMARPQGGVETFSIAFEEKSFDESPYARLAAKSFGTRHHEALCSMEKGRELAPLILSLLDEPMGDSSIIPTYLLCGETRKHVTVALSGDGGDELFAGYDPFLALRLAGLYEKLVPRPVHRAVLAAASFLPVSHGYLSLDFKLKRTLGGLSHPQNLWNPVWMGPLSPAGLSELFGRPMDTEEIYEEAITAWEQTEEKHIVDRTLEFFTRLYLADDILVKSDRAGMMHSLEVRAPFLDADLVDFVRRIPWQYKLRGRRTKYILKKALAPVLPAAIIKRRKKGFGVPVGEWFTRGFFKDAEPSAFFGLDADFAARARSQHLAGKRDHRMFLWNRAVLSFFNPKGTGKP